MWKHINEDYSKVGFRNDAFLQPIQDIHLQYEPDSNGLRTNIYVFSIVAILILVISCVNYVNLTMAQATMRFKEVGVRKVSGANRSDCGQLCCILSLLFFGNPDIQSITSEIGSEFIQKSTDRYPICHQHRVTVIHITGNPAIKIQ